MEYTYFIAGGRRNESRPIQRWRMAFTMIYTCRALSSLKKKQIAGTTFSPRAPSYVALTVRNDNGEFSSPPHPSFPLVDPLVLRTLVKDRQLDLLNRVGGPTSLASMLCSDSVTGVSSRDLQPRRDAFGSNTYPRPKPKGFFWFVLQALNDMFLIVLLICAGTSLAFGIEEHGAEEGWYDGVSIFLAVFLISAVSAVSNFRQMKRFEALSAESSSITVSFVRDGHRQDLSIFEVLVGDVIYLEIGDQVPADGVLLQGHSLQLDESSMTGEIHPVDVDASKNPFLTSGVKVIDGYGSMLVTAVGMDTSWGQMMSKINRETQEKTPLQERLENLTSSIGKFGVAVAVTVLGVLMLRYFTGATKDENGRPLFDKNNATVRAIVDAILDIIQDAVAIIVMAIPEGLPLAVTLTLAFSMQRMMKENAMVRHLSSCETMGSVTAICTDKTGTLTMNQMTVTKFWIADEDIPTSGGISSQLAPELLSLLHQGAGFNTTGSVYQPDSTAKPEISGRPTEAAILFWAILDLGMDIEETKKKNNLVDVEAFNSEKKRSGVLLEDKSSREMTTHWKGAPEMMLARCSRYFDRNGIIREMDSESKAKFEKIVNDMAANCLRCIAFAYKISETGSDQLDDRDLTLLGLVGLKDPCRPEVVSAIATCRNAGVAVKMITGDNVFTARAIAAECGIITPEDTEGLVIEGKEFRGYSPEERMSRIDRIRVVARSSPFDKLLMVQCLKEKGHVVAVTGDGTNDAPALKEADVGLSMGIQGTEVAKESSDIVILNDNFETVVTVMRWGRCVYNNIQKFLQFQLTVNIAALVINLVATVVTGKVPLTTVQLLWVNMIMDTMGALALATDRPTQELMEQPPVGRVEPLITRVMWRNLMAQGIFQVVVLLVFQFKGQQMFRVTEDVNRTLIFNTFVFCQVFNEFNSRKLEKKNVFEGVLDNRLFLGIIALTVLLQVLLVEYLTKFAHTVRLDKGQWLFCLTIAAITWPLGWIVKLLPV